LPKCFHQRLLGIVGVCTGHDESEKDRTAVNPHMQPAGSLGSLLLAELFGLYLPVYLED